jgi:transposase
MAAVSLAALALALLALPPGLALDAASVDASGVLLSLRTTAPTATCPCCGVRATRVHSRYARALADLACGDVALRLRVVVRRFRCPTPACARVVFAERLPALARPHARRTARAAARVTDVGLALGGEAGARLLGRLRVAASADTVLRFVRRAPAPEAPTPRALGVDDWALRRGHTYGTLLFDLDRRTPVDLLPGRDADALAAWLRARPGVEVITRDRAEVYADGARRGAPGALHVADRWHVLKNVGEALERVLHRHRPALTTALAESATDTTQEAPVPELPAPALAPATSTVAAARRAARQAFYDEVQALHAEGASLHAIAAQTGKSRVTVRTYLRAPNCPPRAPRRTKVGTLTMFDAHLRARWAEGCDDAKALWQELVALGFRGTARTVQRHVAGWPTTNPHRRRGHQRPAAAPGAPPLPPTKPPSPRQARWWLVLPAARLTPEQRQYVTRLVAGCPSIATARDLAAEFGRLLRARDVDAFAAWLDTAASSEHSEFRALATSLRRDEAAVTAAVREAWSNGQTEGQVNKLKMLKRQMYGRAGLDLLRQRMLLAA